MWYFDLTLWERGWGPVVRIGVKGKLLAGLCALALSPAAMAEEPQPKWGAFLDVGGKVGIKRNIGAATLFMPLLQDERSMLFGDVRFRADDQNSQEGNFGLGARRMLAEGWNAGVYGFYDRRRTPLANLFNQLTFGAELLGTNFDLRANSYWPIGAVTQPIGTASPGASTASVVGTTLQVVTPATLQRIEYALRGFDAEAGVRIPITPSESPYNLRFYAGAFRFDEPSGAVPIVAGPRLRIEFTDYQVPGLWNGTRFTVGGEWQTDAVRGSQFFAGLRLRVPLQAEPRRASFTLQERRMTDAIVRDVDIVANTQVTTVSPAVTEVASATASGRPITAINSASTSGSNLPTAVANAGANSTAVLSGAFNTTATTTLQPGQTLIGAGPIDVRTTSGRTVTAYLQGGATIAGITGDNPTVTMASNSTLTGLTITNLSSGISRAVLAISVNGATISNSTLSATATGSGIGLALQVLSNVTDLTVSDNTITASGTGMSGAFGVYVDNTTAMMLTRNTISATSASTGAGGVFVDRSSAVTVSNNIVTATGAGYYVRAILASSSTATISGNTLSASGSPANGNYATDVYAMTLNPGSTGNVNNGGRCSLSNGSTGTIGFTNGMPCPSGPGYDSGGGGGTGPITSPPPVPPPPPIIPGPPPVAPAP